MAAALLISNYAGFFTFKERIEAFADGGNPNEEEGPDIDDGGGWVGWKKGYKHVQILDWVGFEVGTQPSVNIQWIDCCKKASQMDACDSKMEHERCAYHSL